jgi:hypothetical protein
MTIATLAQAAAYVTKNADTYLSHHHCRMGDETIQASYLFTLNEMGKFALCKTSSLTLPVTDLPMLFDIADGDFDVSQYSYQALGGYLAQGYYLAGAEDCAGHGKKMGYKDSNDGTREILCKHTPGTLDFEKDVEENPILTVVELAQLPDADSYFLQNYAACPPHSKLVGRMYKTEQYVYNDDFWSSIRDQWVCQDLSAETGTQTIFEGGDSYTLYA